MPEQSSTSAISVTPGTEGIVLSAPDQTASGTALGNDESIELQEEDKKDVGHKKVKFNRPVEKLFERIEELNSWKNVALGLNCLTTAFYLLGNAVAFGFYMYPLLHRIVKHSTITSYVVDTK